VLGSRDSRAPGNAWLNDAVAVASAVRSPGEVILDFYAVS
jgi:hypothetical protein